MTALESAVKFPGDIQIIADEYRWGSAGRGNTANECGNAHSKAERKEFEDHKATGQKMKRIKGSLSRIVGALRVGRGARTIAPQQMGGVIRVCSICSV